MCSPRPGECSPGGDVERAGAAQYLRFLPAGRSRRVSRPPQIRHLEEEPPAHLEELCEGSGGLIAEKAYSGFGSPAREEIHRFEGVRAMMLLISRVVR